MALQWWLDNLAAEQHANQVSRRRKLEEWLGQQTMMFTGYDDGITRRLVERIMMVDVKSIWRRLRDTGMEIGGHLLLIANGQAKKL